MWSSASTQNRPRIVTGSASAMPTIVTSARSGRPARLRITKRARVPTRASGPARSRNVRRNVRGAGGRIASAGASRTTERTEAIAAPPAATSVTSAATSGTDGGSTKCIAGSRKKFT